MIDATDLAHIGREGFHVLAVMDQPAHRDAANRFEGIKVGQVTPTRGWLGAVFPFNKHKRAAIHDRAFFSTE